MAGFRRRWAEMGIGGCPFGSKRSRADKIVGSVSAYAGMSPIGLSYDDWRDNWLPDLERNGILVGLNWSGKRAVGYDLSVADLLRNLSARESPPKE